MQRRLVFSFYFILMTSPIYNNDLTHGLQRPHPLTPSRIPAFAGTQERGCGELRAQNYKKKMKIEKKCDLSTIRRKDILRSMLMGLLNPFLYYLVLFQAYSMLPAQEAVVLNYTWPVLLVLLSIPLLKQKISAFSVPAILISIAGIIVIAWRGSLAGFHFSNIPG
ncbi:MAG: DMT family transporter [Bacteroidetes bacterium]|nr:DMT family transporter [Bacteroidota bacterium]